MDTTAAGNDRRKSKQFVSDLTALSLLKATSTLPVEIVQEGRLCKKAGFTAPPEYAACVYLHDVHAGMLCTVEQHLLFMAAVQGVQQVWCVCLEGRLLTGSLARSYTSACILLLS
jgi:hypothetical protein